MTAVVVLASVVLSFTPPGEGFQQSNPCNQLIEAYDLHLNGDRGDDVDLSDRYYDQVVSIIQELLPKLDVKFEQFILRYVPNAEAILASNSCYPMGNTFRCKLIFSEAMLLLPKDQFRAILAHEFSHGERQILGSQGITSHSYFDKRAADLTSVEAVVAALQSTHDVAIRFIEEHYLLAEQCPSLVIQYARRLSVLLDRIKELDQDASISHSSNPWSN